MAPPPVPRQTLPKVRWIGPATGPEFGPCRTLVRRDARLFDFDPYGKPDLTVLACPRPLVETAATQALLAEVGAARLVQLLGVWCEGEGRTGRVVEGVQRVFWHAWPSWWRQWTAAHTSPPDSHAVSQSAAFQRTTPQRLVRIDTPDGALAGGLQAALDAQGIPATWSRRSLAVGADAIVWDGMQFGGREAVRLAAVCGAARLERVPVVVLLDFPRPETVAAVRAIGADAVLGKPFDIAQLVELLQFVSPRHAVRGESLAPSPRVPTPVLENLAA
ncbi:hypothetical protein Pla108_28950 [Botrimarina colliarenosi]|uniref:Response regulatory domain-containing protein n=1 Tax=Botrimarina colliarenosi TaxID=2528001 RepID=A0A5C6A928_9BACT|nr:response regulator transcription factor [Botrimarina colliarenosi]TWT95818.1 hypothetical protein Pla108_28950 [Botrimarina colliarenosi]